MQTGVCTPATPSPLISNALTRTPERLSDGIGPAVAALDPPEATAIPGEAADVAPGLEDAQDAAGSRLQPEEARARGAAAGPERLTVPGEVARALGRRHVRLDLAGLRVYQEQRLLVMTR